MSVINPTLSLQDNLSNLKAQQTAFAGVIAQLEGLLSGSVAAVPVDEPGVTPVRRGPGRPKLTEAEKAARRAKGKKKVVASRSEGWTEDARAKARRRMKAYWAQRRKEQKSESK